MLSTKSVVMMTSMVLGLSMSSVQAQRPTIIEHTINLPQGYEYFLKAICKNDAYLSKAVNNDLNNANANDKDYSIIRIDLRDLSVATVPGLDYLDSLACDSSSSNYFSMKVKNSYLDNSELNIYSKDKSTVPLWSYKNVNRFDELNTSMWYTDAALIVKFRLSDSKIDNLVAIDKQTGKEIWSKQINNADLREVKNFEGILYLVEPTNITAYSAKDGEFKWNYINDLWIQQVVYDKTNKVLVCRTHNIGLIGLDSESGNLEWTIFIDGLLSFASKNQIDRNNLIYIATSMDFGKQQVPISSSLNWYELQDKQNPVLKKQYTMESNINSSKMFYDLIRVNSYSLVSKSIQEQQAGTSSCTYDLYDDEGQILNSINTDCIAKDFYETSIPNKVIASSIFAEFSTIEIVEK